MEELKERFSRLYKGVLYAIHLDGFTHTVFWKDYDGKRHIDAVSGYAPEQYEESHEAYNQRGQKGYISFNLDKTKVLFMGYPHYTYQGNAKEYLYMPHEEWQRDNMPVYIVKQSDKAKEMIR